MADDVAITAGAGTNIATDDVSGRHFQRVKLDIGADGATTPVTAAAPLPVALDAATLAALETIGLDAATLAALETISVGTFPGDYPDAATLAKLELIRLLLAGTLTVAGTVTANVGSGTQPVSGTVSVNALPAGTANIGDVDVLTLPALPAGTNNIGDVDVLTVPSPLSTAGNGTAATAHRVTLASDSTGVVALTGSLPAGANNIGDVDVLTLPALPAGTNAIGKLAANSGVDIGDVDVTSLPALPTGTNAIGAVTSRLTQTRISVTPTVSTSPAYTAKDAVGGLLTFANAARVAGGTIVIQTVVIIDDSQQMPALDLVLFDRTFTASTDNAIFAPSDADLENVVGVVKVSDWADFSTNSVATRTGLGLAAKLNGTDLFGQLVVRGTPTFVATTDISVIIEAVQD